MKILGKTKILMVGCALLLALNIFDDDAELSMDALPEIASLVKDDVQRIEMSTATDKVILLKEDGQWIMEAPFKGKADQARINALILNFRKGIPMDALIDSGNEKDYGLDSGNAIVVEMWGEGTEAEISFLLGANSVQGASFLRLSGDDNIYRARVGGRHRYEYSARDWLSQQVLPIQILNLRTVIVEEQGVDILQIEKTESEWLVEGVEQSSVDQERVTEAIQSLLALRIGKRISVEQPTVESRIRLSQNSGEQMILNISGISVGAAVVWIEGSSEFFQVASPALERMLKGKDVFENRRLLEFRDRKQLDMLRFYRDEQNVIVQQDLSNGFWNILEPNNIEDRKSVV